MTTTLEIGFADKVASYHVGEGLTERITMLLPQTDDLQRQFVVSDENVGPLWAQSIALSLKAPYFEVKAGEKAKNWATVESIVRFLLTSGASRRDLLIAVGGGVLSDTVGFAAAITQRGMPWVVVPTTLLAMVDAAVGGKTGIDLDLGKNLVGAFWHPEVIIADTMTLTTLDTRQLRAGLAEVIKSAMIHPSLFEQILDVRLDPTSKGDVLGSSELILSAVRVKADIVAVDEREAGPRQALNLGHTLGHALEAAAGYERFLHGEAVAWGLLAALCLARDRGLLSTVEAQAWAARIQTLAPLPPIVDLDWQTIGPFVNRDKKRNQGRTAWVLPRLGGVITGVDVNEAEVAAVFTRLKALPVDGPFSALF